MGLYAAPIRMLGGADSSRRSVLSRPQLSIVAALALCSCADPIWAEGPTFFYEVETPAGTSYLLGTTHVGVSFGELPSAVGELLRSVDAVGFETAPSAPLVDEEVRELGLIPRGEPILSQRLPADVWPRLVSLLEGRTEELRLRRYRPWLARFVLGLQFIEGLPRLEAEMEAEARSNGTALFELESQREQLEVLASIPEDEVLAALILMASDPEGARRQLQGIFDAYRRGDAAHFERTFLEPRDSGEVELLIRARNRRWVAPIRARFESGPTLLAVGAAHLVGDEGLLRLLEAEGLVPRPYAGAE